jgi:hypothetical protein
MGSVLLPSATSAPLVSGAVGGVVAVVAALGQRSVAPREAVVVLAASLVRKPIVARALLESGAVAV